MTEILAVFRSRSQATDCNLLLRKNGIPSNLISTPKEANVGCGLSVKFPQHMLARAQRIAVKYSAFYGFYQYKSLYGRIYVARIN